MLTNNGKLHIKRYLSEQVGGIGSSISFGVGENPEAATDTIMTLEIIRADVNLVTYDYINNRLVFKAAMPDTFAGKVYEVGLWSLPSNNQAGAYGSKNIVTFDNIETWSAGALNTTNARVGVDSLRLSPAVSTTMTASNTDVQLDLSGFSNADTVVVGYYVGNAFTSAVRVRFLTDASNYYTFTVASPAAGYRVSSLAKSTAVTTGTPNWATINQIDVEVTSTAGGAAQVDFDAVRVEDLDTVNPDYVLVSRDLLAAPYVKTAGAVQEIEYSLAVSV